jgi:hypothetical protein
MQRRFKASLSRDLGYTYLLSTTAYKDAAEIGTRYEAVQPDRPKKYILFKLKDME